MALDFLRSLPTKEELEKALGLKGKRLRDGGYRIVIYLDPLWYEKARQIAYARGFLDVDHLVQSYIKEWIENDLSYVEVDVDV